MYSPDQTRQLQDLSKTLLQKQTQKGLNLKDLDSLRKVLQFHEHRYYILNDPLLSDKEYDILYKSLEKVESENPDSITPDSPTRRVARELTKNFPTVNHLIPMLSLENSYDADDLIDWDRKARELAEMDNIEYCVEPKFDGASISLIYENDLLVRGATRGDGVQGDEITTNIKQIRSVPLSAAFSRYGIDQVEIRGEAMINKENFSAYNRQLVEQQQAPLANPRNAAAGSLRIKDPAEVARRKLEVFLYHISYYSSNESLDIKKGEMAGAEQAHAAKSKKAPATHSDSLEMLWDLGFRSPKKEKKVFKSIQAVIDYCLAFEKERDKLPYEIDGMVIKVNSFALQDKMGMTTHHPRWAIAFKFKARQATSKLLKVEFQVGRTGSITPVAKIEPVPIGGVTVGSVSIFNEDVVKQKDLRIGDSVLVERAGDVIPYIVKSLTELRTGKEKKIAFPTHCPACGDELVKVPDEAVTRCVNINCPAQVVERIIHFVSKDAMDIRSFGAANVLKFFELGFLKDIPGVYHLPFKRIAEMEGFGEKSILNLQSAVEESKKQPLHRVIYALGIRYVGETTAKTLAKAVGYLMDFTNFSLEDLEALEDVGPKVAGSIVQFFKNSDNIKMLKKLEDLGINFRNTRSERSETGNLASQSFLFTGTLNVLKRSEAEALVEAQGGKILGGVSSKLNYLIVGEDAGSKLEKAKKIPSIRILTEKEFLQFIGSSKTK
jgi:DNA ligase (NAD+)